MKMMTANFYRQIRVRYLFVLFLLLINSVSCGNEQTQTTEHVKIQDTNFFFRPIDSFQVNEINGKIHLRKSGDVKSPSIFIWGESFGGYSSRDAWLEEVEDNKFHVNQQEIEIDGVSGYIEKYEKDNFLSWRAVLATEQEGIIILVTSRPDELTASETILNTILDSVIVQKKNSDR